jgi:hypothetical protein
MKMVLVFIAWYAVGMIGAALMWFERTCWKWARPELTFLCPTPKVIMLCVFGSFFGPVTFVVGVIAVAISCDVGRDSWWNKPICKTSSQ